MGTTVRAQDHAEALSGLAQIAIDALRGSEGMAPEGLPEAWIELAIAVALRAAVTQPEWFTRLAHVEAAYEAGVLEPAVEAFLGARLEVLPRACPLDGPPG